MEKHFYVRKVAPFFSDQRGSISEILGNATIRHVGLIYSRKGSVRANHYHKRGRQYTYHVSGEMEVLVRRENDSPTESTVAKPGDLVFIAPGVRHAFVALQDSIFLEFSSRRRDTASYEEDTVRLEEPLATGSL